MFLVERWFEAWADLGVPRSPGLERLHADLTRRYCELHRHYHTLRHLAECFGHLAELASYLSHKPESELALWFHDAVYDPQRTDNEALSAAWAVDSARALGVAESAARRIARLILTTRHDTEPEGNDAEAVTDADLGILGADAERFFEYEAQIRQEYAWVSEPDYRAGRAEFLARLLNRPHIFSTERFRSRYEARARANLQASVRRLTEGA
jgi:predicted metal-dependent HD superfamily phosphohydrolase